LWSAISPSEEPAEINYFIDGKGFLIGVKLRSLEKRQGSMKPERVEADQEGKPRKGSDLKRGTRLVAGKRFLVAFEANGGCLRRKTTKS
jgi:hypothetical protein